MAQRLQPMRAATSCRVCVPMASRYYAGTFNLPEHTLSSLSNPLRWLRLFLLAGLMAPLAVALAVTLPASPALKDLLKQPSVVVKVVEPHLSTLERPVTVEYTGYTAESVLDAVFGSAWTAKGLDIEFRALDGYVSRIPNERFRQYRAYLVFERKGQPEFSVDNLSQNEKKVPLGPYYLVWDNIAAPALLPEGGTYWPYQIAQVLLSGSRAEALLPAGMAARFSEPAELAQKYCLTCHQVNGFGGEKYPINLAARVKGLDESTFTRWVLTPSLVKPGTTMPPVSNSLPDGKRQAMAAALYDYLKSLPVKP